MADNIELNELKQIVGHYASMTHNRPEKPSGQCAYEQYDYEIALKSPMYYVTTLSDAEILKTYESYVKQGRHEITEEGFFSLVSAALNVRDPVNTNRSLVMNLDGVAGYDEDRKTRKPSASNKVSFHLMEPTMTLVEVVPTTHAENMETTETASDPKTQAIAAAFIMAWMLRYTVKTPGNALTIQITRMKDTFFKFYGTTSSLFSSFNPSPDMLRGIQNAFQSFPIVRNTLALYMAHHETNYKSMNKQYNVLRYLFFQNMEFMGMHVYVSIVNILNKVSLPPNVVMSWLRVNGSEMAVDQAAEIIMKYDNGSNPANTERLWKYARLINEGYFNRLQTTYAPDLVAMLAFIEIKLGLSPETGYSSPLNIYAIKNNLHLQDMGRRKAEIFIECKNALVSLSSEASVLDKILARRVKGFLREPTAGGSQQPPSSSGTKRPAEEAPTPADVPSVKRSTVPLVVLATPPTTK